MAAGLGFKTFTTGEVLTAADTNGYLMQGINVFASTAARDAAITSPQEGQFAYTKDTNSLWYYTGSAWAASGATGDIEGVTAGVGITGGGTSGTVTITNDMATTITAAGDIVVGTGSGTYDNLPIGTTAQVLTADTTVSPYKVKWATPSSGAAAFVGAKVYKSASQSIPNATWTTLTFNSESFDTDGFHDTSSNTSRMTIPSGKGGKYLVQWQAVWDPNATGSRNTKITLNGGTDVAYGTWSMALTGAGSSTIHANTAVLSLSVADYIEIQIGQESGGNLNANGGANDGNTFSIIYLGA
jgi:hypothetical protein